MYHFAGSSLCTVVVWLNNLTLSHLAFKAHCFKLLSWYIMLSALVFFNRYHSTQKYLRFTEALEAQWTQWGKISFPELKKKIKAYGLQKQMAGWETAAICLTTVVFLGCTMWENTALRDLFVFQFCDKILISTRVKECWETVVYDWTSIPPCHSTSQGLSQELSAYQRPTKWVCVHLCK